ncbi:MAG: DUF3800 domain-containing protein [Spirochaetota bacterium]|nr:DUF3800 domain-containing protein [Spirochaetota bacterium]
MEEKIKQLHAYIDETGTNALNFDTDHVSQYFVCLATIVDEDLMLTVRNSILELKQELNMQPEHELKSKKLRSKRRTIALQKIQKLPIQFCAFVVDKKYLKQDSGLSYKKSFYKYINRVFYQAIFANTKKMDLVIHADKIGSDEFQEEFSSYLNNYTQRTLFDDTNWTHEFVDSKESEIIQISDIVSGTLTKYIDKNFSGNFEKICYDMIKNQFINIHYFPYKILPSINTTVKDEEIFNYQQKKCDYFFRDYREKQENDYRIRIEVLELLINNTFSDQIINSSNLISYLESVVNCKINHRFLTTNIIGKIREYGIIIVGTKKGYKLATSTKDVDEYIKHDENIIYPMLKKLLAAKNGIYEFSKTELFFEITTLSKIIEIYETGENVRFRID